MVYGLDIFSTVNTYWFKEISKLTCIRKEKINGPFNNSYFRKNNVTFVSNTEIKNEHDRGTL